MSTAVIVEEAAVEDGLSARINLDQTSLISALGTCRGDAHVQMPSNSSAQLISSNGLCRTVRSVITKRTVWPIRHLASRGCDCSEKPARRTTDKDPISPHTLGSGDDTPETDKRELCVRWKRDSDCRIHHISSVR